MDNNGEYMGIIFMAIQQWNLSVGQFVFAVCILILMSSFINGIIPLWLPGWPQINDYFHIQIHHYNNNNNNQQYEKS